MFGGGKKKTTKKQPNKNSIEKLIVIIMEKNFKMLEKKFKSYKENISSYLAAKNEFFSKRINELNGKFNALWAGIEHSGKVKLENLKAIDRDVSHINGTFWIHAKNTKTYFYKIEEQLRWLEYSSQRNNLTIEGVREEEASNETWDQWRKKISVMLKFNLEVNNVKTEWAHRVPGEKKTP